MSVLNVKMKRFLYLYFIYVLKVNQELLADVVEVEQGILSGTDYVTSTGKTIFAFYGVPYAAPPVHKFRFKEPQPLKPWTGIWNASVLSNVCFQVSGGTSEVIGEDDCLYVNIFTPKLPTKNGVNPLLNVIVNIHGGAYMTGTGNEFYPDYLLKSNDVVLATFNYRLGPMGFFSFGDEIVPGNNGLKDQFAALKWINKNIARFGGNPDRITLYGLSAGATFVFLHYLSPLSNKLFARGISSSAAMYPTSEASELVKNNSKSLAALLGCALDSSKETVKCLQRRPGKQIIEMAKSLVKWEMFPFSHFRPVIEPEHAGSFLDKSSKWLIENGKVPDKPWLFGLTDHEGLVPCSYVIDSDDLLKEVDENWHELVPYILDFDFISDKKQLVDIANRLKTFYLQNRPLLKNTTKEFVQMCGDRYFYVVTRNIAKIYSSLIRSPVFCYKFGFRGNFSFSNQLTRNNVNYGVSHADEIQYIFNFKYLPKPEEYMVNLMSDVIVSFANYGKPIVNNLDWFPISKDFGDLNCLHIADSNKTQMVTINDSAADELWARLLNEELNYELKDRREEL